MLRNDWRVWEMKPNQISKIKGGGGAAGVQDNKNVKGGKPPPI